MADIAKVSVSLDSRSANWAQRLEGGLYAGEDLAAGDLVMAGTGNQVVKSDGTLVLGIVVDAYSQNDVVTVWQEGTRVSYGSGLTPFAEVFASEAVDGALADATGASTIDAIGMVCQDGKSIMIKRLQLA